MELTFLVIIMIIFSAFICEYFDSALGMGYGTILTPVFLIFGFSPMQIIPSILLSELITGIFSALLHHREGNVIFKPKITNHLQIALLLAICSIIGTVIAVLIAVNVPKFWIKLYIGALVFSMGLIILMFHNKKFKFSLKKIFGLGLIASFNKGISGGGYGPLVMSGQILSGVNSKNAPGITGLAEGLTCLVGLITYMIIGSKSIDWILAPYIILGAVLSVPLATKSIKIISANKLKLLIAFGTISLGLWTIIKTLL